MRAGILVLMVMGGGCAHAPAPTPVAKPAPPPKRAGGELNVEHQGLRVSPLEMVFSGVRGQAEAEEYVSVKNVSQQSVLVRNVAITGPAAVHFTVTPSRPLPWTLLPGQTADAAVAFRPTAAAATGALQARLQIHLGGADELGPIVDVSALVTAGEGGENEPPLADIINALGYGIDVGGRQLLLGIDAKPIGEEVPVTRFKPAQAGPVALDPVARYAPAGAASYGYFVGPGPAPTQTPLGAFNPDQAQRINPELEGEGKISFEPGPQPFGLWVTTATHTAYTDPALNKNNPAGTAQHAARVFPLRSRNGTPIPHAFMIAFEEAKNGDYQDYVFVLWNVVPAP